MSYTTLPLRVSDFRATGAIGVTTIAALVAAPGAGKRHRIVGGHLTLDFNSTGLVRISLAGTSFANPDIRANMAASGTAGGTPSDKLIIPEPGIEFPINEAINIADVAGIVGVQTYGIVVYYFTDNVT